MLAKLNNIENRRSVDKVQYQSKPEPRQKPAQKAAPYGSAPFSHHQKEKSPAPEFKVQGSQLDNSFGNKVEQQKKNDHKDYIMKAKKFKELELESKRVEILKAMQAKQISENRRAEEKSRRATELKKSKPDASTAKGVRDEQRAQMRKDLAAKRKGANAVSTKAKGGMAFELVGIPDSLLEDSPEVKAQ